MKYCKFQCFTSFSCSSPCAPGPFARSSTVRAMKRKPSANLQPFEVVAKNPRIWASLEPRSPVPTSALIKATMTCKTYMLLFHFPMAVWVWQADFSSTPDFPSPLAMRGRVLIAADPLLLLCPQVGSVCSGMGIDFLALREVLGRKFVESAVEHTFVCEKNKSASAFLKDNFTPKLFLKDVMSDAFLSAPRVDIFTSGFPCQPFSPIGLGEGEADNQGRGLLIWQIIRYFRVSPPSLFILENVEALLTRHPDTFRRIIEELRKIKDARGEHMFSKPFFKTFTTYILKTFSNKCACRRTVLPRGLASDEFKDVWRGAAKPKSPLHRRSESRTWTTFE